jgi:hypothetical protein
MPVLVLSIRASSTERIAFVVRSKYNGRMKQNVVQIRIEPELTALIEEAVERTGLTRSELLRQGLRKGVPEVVRALGGAPKRTLVDALREMKGLEIPERSSGMKRRL